MIVDVDVMVSGCRCVGVGVYICEYRCRCLNVGVESTLWMYECGCEVSMDV